MNNLRFFHGNFIMWIWTLSIYMINVILYITTNIILNNIHYLNIVYYYKNTNISENIVNINYNLRIFILLTNILNIAKMAI